MVDLPLEIYNAYGGTRIMAAVSLKDSRGSLGFVKALVDTGSPNTMIFENLLKKFRRLRPVSFAQPQYTNLGGMLMERKNLGELVIGLRDVSGTLLLYNQEVSAGDNPNQRIAQENPVEMIIGLDFLISHHAVLDLKDPSKPILHVD